MELSMQRLAATGASGLLLGPFLTALTLAAPANASPAKCLFEIGNAHYIGSVCEFAYTDGKGSFRIADAGGSNIAAEVTVTAPGKGVASWASSHTPARKQPLGEVEQAGACWSDGESYICAWALEQDVYLGPLQRKLFVSYGERGGMDDEIESATGLDTSHAMIHTKPSRRAAAYYCGGQLGHTKTCLEEVYRDRTNAKDRTITADCLTKEWTGLGGSAFDGSRFRFLGAFEAVDCGQFADNGGVAARWAILDVASNSLVGDCGACSYFEIHDWYQKLCPSTAPHEW
jgi:hypothetical protein